MSLFTPSLPPLELWGGVECTVNRVEDRFYDQLERTGHADRPDDLNLFASLGVRALRYPILWERIAPNGLATANWEWPDERLNRLRQLAIRPIVGLVHHGAGPATTSLVNRTFAEKLAAFAGAVARRYPWVEDYTPINEPITTARFSGLYGWWHPHATNDASFARIVINQCRGIVLAMKAIRAVNPTARLIQTEDLGKTFSTPALVYQAEFNNNRRWLGLDLLYGRLNHCHPMWEYLRWAQIKEDELSWFLDNPCPPDVIGLDYYLTSERFLEEHCERYPSNLHAGNQQHRYVDIEAVRVRAAGIEGLAGALREIWQRYGQTLAVTETHLSCTREQQLRWLVEAWQTTEQVRREGVDIQALTAWALLGAFDWNSLLTRCEDHYEPGVFDVRGPKPRPTALAAMLRHLQSGRRPDHPVLAGPGWWQYRKRLLYPAVNDQGEITTVTEDSKRQRPARPLLILGADSNLGYAFARLSEHRGLSYHACTQHELDITNPASISTMIAQLHPWAVINAVSYREVDKAEKEVHQCYRDNVIGPAVLAAACAEQAIPLMTFSSDLVFDGQQTTPYLESNTVAPLNIYGQSKAEAEERVLAIQPNALIIRTSPFFGPWNKRDFVTVTLQALASGRGIQAAHDATISPTYIPDLVHTALDLLIDGESHIWHLANEGALTWADWACLVARSAGYPEWRIERRTTTEMGWSARRPSYSALRSERGQLLPPLDQALHSYFQDCDE